MRMPNNKKPTGRSEIQTHEREPEARPRHFALVDGIVRSLLPRLGEIRHPLELLWSESTLELIEYMFSKHRVEMGELSQGQLVEIAKAMPPILVGLRRLGYDRMNPAMYGHAKSFSELVESEIKARHSGTREKIGEILGD